MAACRHTCTSAQISSYSSEKETRLNVQSHLFSLNINSIITGTYLGVEHVGDSLEGSLQQESSHKEADEHHVGKDGGEIHHLKTKTKEKNTFKVEIGYAFIT